MTLVELLIASTLLIIVLTAVMVTMTTLNNVSTSVNAQTQEFEQALPALAPLQNLIRAEVEPAAPTTVSGFERPTPGFATIGNFSLTFYSDIGTTLGNTTSLGTTGGPVKVVAQEVDSTGTAVSSSSICSTTSPCSFQVTEQLPQITAGVSQCPVAGQSGTACTYGPAKLLVNATGVTNNPNPSKGAIQPIFSYMVLNPSGSGCTLVTTCTATPTFTSSVPSSGSGAIYTCTAQAPSGATPLSQTCNDYIQSVGVELMVAKSGAGTNNVVDEQTVIYRYKQFGSTYAPYQPSCFYDATESCPS